MDSVISQPASHTTLLERYGEFIDKLIRLTTCRPSAKELGDALRNVINQSASSATSLENYRDFISEFIRLTAGGPPAKELIAAIEDGTVNMNAYPDWIGSLKALQQKC